MKISVVVPVHNEAENIVPLITEIVQAMKGATAYEVIYVNDGSKDETATVLNQALLDFPTLRVIKHDQSYGQSTAVHTGIKHAIYPWIATLDGDGQNDPADIPHLYDVLLKERKHRPKLAMIAGWRNKRHDTGWRIFSSKFANGIRAKLLGDETPDTGCGLKVFSRESFLELPYFNHMHRFLPALILRAGGEVISEPVNHRSRTNGVSNYGTLDRLWAGIMDIAGVIWLQKRAKRPVVEEIKRK